MQISRTKAAFLKRTKVLFSSLQFCLLRTKGPIRLLCHIHVSLGHVFHSCGLLNTLFSKSLHTLSTMKKILVEKYKSFSEMEYYMFNYLFLTDHVDGLLFKTESYITSESA